MKVILIDDEKHMLLIIKRMISEISGIESIEAFQSSSGAFDYIKENSVDIAFIDIKMPKENGLEFARKIVSEFSGIDLVFLTAYKKYALDAFEVNATDYIVKPVTRERLEQTINRAAQKRNLMVQGVRSVLPKLSVICLGRFEIRDREGRIVKLLSSKSFELLAYLLLNKGRFVSKWSVIEDVFSEMTPHNAEIYLNTTVYKLRKALRSHGASSIIITANEGYTIDLDDIYIDFVEFEAGAAGLHTIDGTNLEAAVKTEKLFSGEIFGDRGYSWSLPEKERLSVLYLNLAKRLVQYLIEEKNLDEALQILKRLNNKYELDEEINCLLMHLYAARGDRISLMRQQECYKRLLKRELGIGPGKMTAELYESLLKSI